MYCRRISGCRQSLQARDHTRWQPKPSRSASSATSAAVNSSVSSDLPTWALPLSLFSSRVRHLTDLSSTSKEQPTLFMTSTCVPALLCFVSCSDVALLFGCYCHYAPRRLSPRGPQGPCDGWPCCVAGRFDIDERVMYYQDALAPNARRLFSNTSGTHLLCVGPTGPQPAGRVVGSAGAM